MRDPRDVAVTTADFAGHLAWCQNPAVRGDWTRVDDLALVEAVIAGGLARAARRLGLTEGECKARWDKLYPAGLRGIAFQEILLRQLRAAIGLRG